MTKVIPWLQKLTLATLILFFCVSLTGLGRNYLFDWDEGIYATIGREMRESENLLTPTWNNEIWLEKPPMIAWVTALGQSIAGENELGSRLFMPFFALLTLYAVFRIGEHLGGTIMGTVSVAVLGYFNLFLARTRTLNTDGILLSGITWSFWLLLSNASPIWVGLAMGLSIMIKGPAGILAILICLPLLLKKDKKFIIRLLAVVSLVVVPWHVYAYITHGNAFLTPYLLEQVIRRATVPIEFHTESRFFYLNFLYQDLGLGVILTALFGLLVTRNFLLIWWLALPLFIFTLAKTRLSWYILPVYPAIALLIGSGFSVFLKSKKNIVAVTILSVGMLAQLLFHAYSYVAPFRDPTPLSGLLQLASSMGNYDGSEIAMLVSENERVAEAILPIDQTISSSFRYGGAPSVVWYSHKHVTYYYNYDLFMADLVNNQNISLAITTVKDRDKVPSSFNVLSEQDGYIGYIRGDSYALR
ncbi:glycosyltransferase family 39 protein [Candidatus Woesebacteria bacterium]|nr:glycosyltransferase family 39 protein [Candidatus Woesebacteria bacterium]